MTSGIYKIVNENNGKVYIGQTTNFEHRANAHYSALKNATHNNIPLLEDWLALEDCTFTFSVIKECRGNDLNRYERFYIREYKANDPRYGYNISAGGGYRRHATMRNVNPPHSQGDAQMCRNCQNKCKQPRFAEIEYCPRFSQK